MGVVCQPIEDSEESSLFPFANNDSVHILGWFVFVASKGLMVGMETREESVWQQIVWVE